MNDHERLKHYTADYLLYPKTDPNRKDYWDKRLREDMFACLCYAYGLDLMQMHTAWDMPAKDFKEQLANAKKFQVRRPELVVNVGCGRGELDATFAYDGIPCIGLDPSPGAKEVYPKTMKEWVGYDSTRYDFCDDGIYDGLQGFYTYYIPDPDTIILNESLEHIPEEEFNQSWPLIKGFLSRTHGLFIVSNWIHPIKGRPQDWDHVRNVDDKFYDLLCKDASKVILRWNAHLVLQF